MATDQKLMTAEEYALWPDGGVPTELIDGMVVELTPPGGGHGWSSYTIARLVGDYVDDHWLGYVLVGDAGIVLARNPDRVRGPDICFYAADRLPDGPPDGFLDIVPDFVIEVISPGDRPGEVRQKTDEWLNAGVRLVWNVYRRTRSVMAETPHARTEYREGDTVTGAPVLPNIRVRVAALFGAWPRGRGRAGRRTIEQRPR